MVTKDRLQSQAKETNAAAKARLESERWVMLKLPVKPFDDLSEEGRHHDLLLLCTDPRAAIIRTIEPQCNLVCVSVSCQRGSRFAIAQQNTFRDHSLGLVFKVHFNGEFDVSKNACPPGSDLMLSAGEMRNWPCFDDTGNSARLSIATAPVIRNYHPPRKWFDPEEEKKPLAAEVPTRTLAQLETTFYNEVRHKAAKLDHCMAIAEDRVQLHHVTFVDSPRDRPKRTSPGDVLMAKIDAMMSVDVVR
jgi:hypothetical protein